MLNGLSRRSNSGRIRKTTRRQHCLFKAIVVRSPRATSARIAHDARNHDIHVSSRIVRRRLLSEFNLVAQRSAKKPLMTEKQRLARMKFCKKMMKKPDDWRDRVMFSDESTCSQVRGSGSNYVRRPPGEHLNPKYTLKTIKHPLSLTVWGGITTAGRCSLEIFEKGVKVNAARYIEVLEAKVKIHMQLTGSTIFQQDSAPCHMVKVVKKWFVDYGVEIYPTGLRTRQI